jgi:hypothetical protein
MGLVETGSLLRTFLVRMLGTYNIQGLVAFLDYYQEVYERYYLDA